MIRFHLKWIGCQMAAGLREFSFWLMTVLLMLGFVLAGTVTDNYNGSTGVLVYAGNSETGRYCTKYLTDNAPEGFVFYEAESIENLKDAVRTNDVSCGIVFGDDADSFRDEDGVVDIYQSAGSVDGYVVRELVYPAMCRAAASDELSEYMKGLEWDDADACAEADEYVEGVYSEFLKEDSVKLYELSDTSGTGPAAVDDGTQIGAAHAKNEKMWICLGITALVLLICIYDVNGSDKGFYYRFRRRTRVILKLERVLMTIVMSTALAAAAAAVYNGVNHG